MSQRLFAIWLLLAGTVSLCAQRSFTVTGTVADAADGHPIAFATVTMGDEALWAITDDEGRFAIQHVPSGQWQLRFQCLGYADATLHVAVDDRLQPLAVTLRANSLKLEEVQVVARRKSEDVTTSYLIDRTTLDNQQLLNLSDIATLLPGGKTANSTLLADSRLSLRSGDAEKGNASFGTAIEVDGVRMQNNALMGETTGASTRTLNADNIESVEVVTGIASVEHGDLANGLVKVKTRHGKTPFVVNLSVSPHTRQVGASKGFALWGGILNAAIDHTRSISDIASPHTSYTRNTLSVNYQQTIGNALAPLLLNVGMRANLGGYNSEADPDAFSDTYSKARDYALHAHFDMSWLLNRSWITNVLLAGSVDYGDKKTTRNSNESSSSAQPYIHTMEPGYFIATEYDADPQANIVLGPTGYWYVKSHVDSKPVAYRLKMKADWTRHTATGLTNKLLAGAEWTSNGNEGRGLYYADRRYAPTWREYRYDRLPYLNNWAFYAEDKLSLPVAPNRHRGEQIDLTAGIRADVTAVSHSAYGTVGSWSPRTNVKYTALNRHGGFVSRLAFYGGWGKSVKLPSFEVLYPSPSYADRLAFAPGTTADGKAFYAYHTMPFKAAYNAHLKWQEAHQVELGVEATTAIGQVSLAAFSTTTRHPYIATATFTPYTYLLTGQEALEGLPIASEDRHYAIDPASGVVTVADRRGVQTPVTLPYTVRHAYNQNVRYANGSPVRRTGLDWMVDFKPIAALKTQLRLDGNYYHYKGVEETLIASMPSSASEQADGQPYPYVGYYRGSSVYGAGSTAYATAANGSVSDQVNANLTVTTHIPKIRLVISLRLESSLYSYRRALSQQAAGTRGIVLQRPEDYFGQPYDGTSRDQYVGIYPEYYSTWEAPDVLIPFEERLLWAYDHDAALFDELSKLVVKTNYNYNFNPERLSAYGSANLNITKEIGNSVSVSFLANNFLNTLQKLKTTRTGRYATLYNAGYVSPFYYGLSVRVKL